MYFLDYFINGKTHIVSLRVSHTVDEHQAGTHQIL